MTAVFEDIQKSNHIAVYVGFRIFKAVSNPGLGGQVADNIKLLPVKNFSERAAVLKI